MTDACVLEKEHDKRIQLTDVVTEVANEVAIAVTEVAREGREDDSAQSESVIATWSSSRPPPVSARLPSDDFSTHKKEHTYDSPVRVPVL